jgi:hypothetical protein
MRLQDPLRRVYLRATEYRDLPSPTLFIEDDGDWCLDWDLDPHHTVSVSISATGQIRWAAYIKGIGTHGSFHVDEWGDDNNELDTALNHLNNVD